MKKPSIPYNEKQRIHTLHSLNLLDTPIQESFERITRLARSLFQVPIVAFSLVDSERQWFKSIQGLNVCETSREISFCGHTINQPEALIINDTLLDERFSDNPLVTEEPKIRFYAGCPVNASVKLKKDVLQIEPKKYRIGALCLIDQKPRRFTKLELLQLKDFVGLIEAAIEANKITENQLHLMSKLSKIKQSSLLDKLTRLLNRFGMEEVLEKKVIEAKKNKTNFGVALVSIDDFQKLKQELGLDACNDVLTHVTKNLLSAYRNVDLVGHWGADEFLILFDSTEQSTLVEIANRVRMDIASEPIIHQVHEIQTTITSGLSYFNHEAPVDFLDLVSLASKAMLLGKNRGGNIVMDSTDHRIKQ